MDSKITKILMDSGADSMIPNIANKESAFHYCGQSGNAAVRKQLFSDLSWEEVSLVLTPLCAFAGGQRDHQVPSRWPDPTSGEQAVRVSVFFLHFLAQFFCYSQLFPGRKDSCFLGLFCLTPWDVSQTEPECNRTSKYLFLEVGRKYIHPLKIATEIDCHDSCLLPLGSSGLDFFVLKRLTLYRL